MKKALRRGGYSALNIYFQSNLSAYPNQPGSTTLLGYCTLPTKVTYTYNGMFGARLLWSLLQLHFLFHQPFFFFVVPFLFPPFPWLFFFSFREFLPTFDIWVFGEFDC